MGRGEEGWGWGVAVVGREGGRSGEVRKKNGGIGGGGQKGEGAIEIGLGIWLGGRGGGVA